MQQPESFSKSLEDLFTFFTLSMIQDEDLKAISMKLNAYDKTSDANGDITSAPMISTKSTKDGNIQNLDSCKQDVTVGTFKWFQKFQSRMVLNLFAIYFRVCVSIKSIVI